MDSGTSQVLRYSGYLRRVSSISAADFSKLWSDHAALAAPWFIYHKITGYTQTHLSSPEVRSLAANLPMKGLEYDGMVDLEFNPNTCSLFNPENDKHNEKQKSAARRYFEEVILVDERRFWDRTGTGNAKEDLGWEDGRSGVIGQERRVIVNGKIVIDMPEDVRLGWEEYEEGVVV